MKNLIYIFFVLMCSAGCNEAAQNKSLLTQPPYGTLTDSIRNDPQNAGLYYRRGALLYRNEQLAAAEQDLKQAWQLQPTEVHALSVVTVLIKRNGDSAIQFIQRVLPQLPKSIALQIALARGYQQKGDLEKALEVCERVLLIYPNALDALLLKAEVLKQQNNHTAALATLEQAYSYAPFDLELSYNLAFEYAEAKDKKVLPLADSLIWADTTGKQAQPYYLKGVYYANMGNPAQALDYFNQAIARDYNFFDAYMDKGALLYEQKKYKEALQVFALVARITPTYADSYFWAGKCHEALGNKEEAKRAYQQAHGLDATLTEAKEAAAKL
jgi:tetratricopeptide (TPR) repeat protein